MRPKAIADRVRVPVIGPAVFSFWLYFALPPCRPHCCTAHSFEAHDLVLCNRPLLCLPADIYKRCLINSAVLFYFLPLFSLFFSLSLSAPLCPSLLSSLASSLALPLLSSFAVLAVLHTTTPSAYTPAQPKPNSVSEKNNNKTQCRPAQGL